jgi:hypothetical protein
MGKNFSDHPVSVHRLVIKSKTFREQDVYQASGEEAGPLILTGKPRSLNYLYICFYDPVSFAGV